MKKSEIIPKVIEVITPAASPAVVWRNDRTLDRKNEITATLNSTGFVAVVDPLAGSGVGSGGGNIVTRGAIAGKSAVIIHLRHNPVKAPTVTADAVLDIADKIVVTLLAAHIGVEVSGEYLSETFDEDPGITSYQIIISVTTETSA